MLFSEFSAFGVVLIAHTKVHELVVDSFLIVVVVDSVLCKALLFWLEEQLS